ncbi:MAG: cupin-like domain-containing protein, partial [Actinobacteria bacterium]|nr:cupin-like domain-containing protein [Actinomycetota bacterium]
MRTRTTPIRTRTPTTPSTTTASALARAIEPLDTGTFARLHWEREPLHRARGEEGRFDDLLSARDAERLVCDPGLRAPAFRLVKAGEQLDARAYTTDLGWRPQPFTGAARLERVLAEFERGATIVLQALHLNWRPVARFCRALEAELGHPAQANAYLTPRRSQGLPVHHDTHDVFVLQVSGSKRWLVYPPALELPLRDQRYSPSLGGADEAPTLDVELGPGDTLYLPRGWLHQALTSDTDSLHLTIGVNAYTWYDALRAALERCTDEVALRRAVPLDGEGGPELLELLAGRLEPPAVAAAMRGRL